MEKLHLTERFQNCVTSIQKRIRLFLLLLVFSFTQSSALKSLLQSIYEVKNRVELKLSIYMYIHSLTLENINDINGH